MTIYGPLAILGAMGLAGLFYGLFLVMLRAFGWARWQLILWWRRIVVNRRMYKRIIKAARLVHQSRIPSPGWAAILNNSNQPQQCLCGRTILPHSYCYHTWSKD